MRAALILFLPVVAAVAPLQTPPGRRGTTDPKEVTATAREAYLNGGRLPVHTAELADLHRRADELPCGTNYSHACFGAIAPEAAKAAHHERSKLMMRVYALEHDEAYVAAKFAVAHAPA